MRARRFRTVVVIGNALALAATLTSCSGTASKSSSADRAATAGGNAVHIAPKSAENGAAAKPAVDLAAARRPADDREIISTAQLDVQSRDIDDTVQRATTIVIGAQGYVFAETASLAAGPHARVVFKVAPERFSAVVNDIGRLGKLVHRRIGTQDVTGQVVDLNARLAAAQTSAARLRELLADSGGVADLLSVEQQLTAREGQVDSLSGALAALRAQVDMATITLEVTPLPKRAAAVAAAEKPGFTRGLRAGSDAFGNSARVASAGVGLALPFLPIALLAMAIWWFARRRTTAATGPS